MTFNFSIIWIFLSAWCVLGGGILSQFGMLNRTGYAVLLALGLIATSLLFKQLNWRNCSLRTLRWKRLARPFPVLFFFCAGAALLGGALYLPSNYDAFCYRIPRMLHWLAAGHWHWIGGFNTRMDYSSLGFEWLMLPPLAAFHTLRLAFLINVISYCLLPGLIFMTFRGLGAKRAVAATWMWILPCASCFALEAGSIGNDLLATDYLLIALVFTLKARATGHRGYIWTAIVAAGLMTGAKASNLPLLLPIAIAACPLFYRRPGTLLTAIPAGLIALLVSFAPLAMANLRYAGDWTGNPESHRDVQSPLMGITGNLLQLTTANLTPAVFPTANLWNRFADGAMTRSPLQQIKTGFPKLSLTVKELASEEISGLGLGVTAALALGILGCLGARRSVGFDCQGILIALSFWVGLGAYMVKIGNESGPRLLAPYYPGLFLLPLLLPGQIQVIRQKWWRWASVIFLLPIIPALLFNPARPLMPVFSLIDLLQKRGSTKGVVERMQTVYSVYARRPDPHAEVRKLLPKNAKIIGFAGTSDESEVSFWLPLGEREVRDFTPRKDGQLPDASGLDAIVTSDWGCGDRFKKSPQELAQALGWRVVATASAQTYAATGPRQWSILVPSQP